MTKPNKTKIKVKVEKPLMNKPNYKQPLQFNIEKEIVPDKIQPKKIFDLMGATPKPKPKPKPKTKSNQ
tara:strand:+ start:1450 stop:1653 length:204 start_codon:yes stop_codon:yes gene_type:complete